MFYITTSAEHYAEADGFAARLACAVRRLSEKSEGVEMAVSEESRPKSEAGDIAALEHARAMTIHASQLRMKNFNFFIVLAGVLLATFANFKTIGPQWFIGVLGSLISAAFLVLDVRGKQLLRAGKRELARAELALGVCIQATAKATADEAGFARAVVSHTFVYRFLYLAGLILSLYLVVGQ